MVMRCCSLALHSTSSTVATASPLRPRPLLANCFSDARARLSASQRQQQLRHGAGVVATRSLAPRNANEGYDSDDQADIAHYGEYNVADLARQRGGWLCFFSIGLVLAASIVQDFDALISKHVELSFFVPLIMGHGGNSGSQTSSALVRALALKQVSPKAAPEVITKEAFAGCMMGGALGALILALTLTTHCFSTEVGLVVAIALPVVSLWANTLGAALTLTSAKLRLDPGLTSAPLVTTLVDTTGLMIYFSIARAVISPDSFLTNVVADNAVMAALQQPPGS